MSGGASLMTLNVRYAQRTVKAKRTPVMALFRRMNRSELFRTEEAQRLVDARVHRGFSEAAAAAKFFGWNYDTYIQHERGERGLRKAVAEKYAKAYRVSTAWLMTGEGTMDRVSDEIRVGPPEPAVPLDLAHEAILVALRWVGTEEDVATEVARLLQALLQEPPLDALSGDALRSLRVRSELAAPQFARTARR